MAQQQTALALARGSFLARLGLTRQPTHLLTPNLSSTSSCLPRFLWPPPEISTLSHPASHLANSLSGLSTHPGLLLPREAARGLPGEVAEQSALLLRALSGDPAGRMGRCTSRLSSRPGALVRPCLGGWGPPKASGGGRRGAARGRAGHTLKALSQVPYPRGSSPQNCQV
uniref:Uncharacterized protein n=1 Tax=Pipistrellus kuhlii TaxID=59472 RepID=A0A7J8B1A5_PIPKU|nr:hypothetical protein mPipKuh1_007659 [Pipistrellus kuhlii]